MNIREQRRSVRRLAMQALYQIDVTGETDPERVMEGLDESFDPPEVREAAAELALAAWQGRAEADALVAELAPDWPTHRQPPVDRAILRLACHEMTSGRTPVKVAINEAVELAKQYGSENSPPFVNGVLDKAAKRVSPPEGPDTPEAPKSTGEPRAGEPATPEDWLKDALTGKG